MDFKSILALLSWKPILIQLWKDVLPKLEELVLSTESPWDDTALNAVKLLVNKFLIDETLEIKE